MERVLSGEEKIRRAEEMYYSRRNQVARTTSARVNVSSDNKDYRLLKKMAVQILVCMLIYFTFYIVKNSNYIFSEEVISRVKSVLSYDMNIMEQYNKIMEWINSEPSEEATEEQQTPTENAITESVTDIIENQGGAVEDSTLVNLEDIFEESSISQTELDANEIKEKYSLIKPLSGEITSRFGLREPTTETVPKYHTGIDIAANTGTPFVSAMEGEVVLVSSQGDYR